MKVAQGMVLFIFFLVALAAEIGGILMLLLGLGLVCPC